MYNVFADYRTCVVGYIDERGVWHTMALATVDQTQEVYRELQYWAQYPGQFVAAFDALKLEYRFVD